MSILPQTDEHVPLTLNELDIYSKTNHNTLIVLYFKATWCVPCKAIKPFIAYLIENYPNVKFYEIDIQDDTRETIVNNFSILKVPTFIFYKNSILYNSILGTNKEKIEELVNEYL